MYRDSKGGTATSSCGCQGGSCSCSAGADCASDGGLLRPLFFTGQLLTDEDLQKLADYAVEKNRLHNRNYLGDGVVCGLQVKRHPCDATRLVVEPGHAIDCCGNDIVVGC